MESSCSVIRLGVDDNKDDDFRFRYQPSNRCQISKMFMLEILIDEVIKRHDNRKLLGSEKNPPPAQKQAKKKSTQHEGETRI